MVKVLKGTGWLLIALGAMSLFCAVLVVFDEDQKRSAVLGLLMFTGFFGFPGGILLWRGTRLERELAFREELSGYLRTHDRFTAEEMARKIGRTELETEALIARIASEDKLELAFHRADRTYVHRSRITTGARVYDQCPSCGATLKSELILEGEAVACTYCGRNLDASAAG